MCGTLTLEPLVLVMLVNFADIIILNIMRKIYLVPVMLLIIFGIHQNQRIAVKRRLHTLKRKLYLLGQNLLLNGILKLIQRIPLI
ncbi:hypothetical protein O3M35_008294 [Rhynocoris fuscipes]|uniref:Uncharacterized protein n=1 Tax=Rhynocoris fuscipes TaxID=488301 RepID=A0AAW1D5T9_9HEMI